jgi:hypothetical protein
MAVSLPSALLRESAIAIMAAIAACSTPPAPVAPGPPIPAEPDLAVDTMAVECGALVASLETWRQCVNLDEEEREYITAWIERANMDFAAGAKANPDAKAQHAIAHNCRRAASSVSAATERCHNGKRPKI